MYRQRKGKWWWLLAARALCQTVIGRRGVKRFMANKVENRNFPSEKTQIWFNGSRRRPSEESENKNRRQGSGMGMGRRGSAAHTKES